MISSHAKRAKRTVDVTVAFDVPAGLQRLSKDVSLSFHADDISGDTRAHSAPWTDAVRLVGADDVFVVRMKVPAGIPFLLHAVALIDEPGSPPPAVRRHIGFTNLRVEPDAPEQISIRISHFESYALLKT